MPKFLEENRILFNQPCADWNVEGVDRGKTHGSRTGPACQTPSSSDTSNESVIGYRRLQSGSVHTYYCDAGVRRAQSAANGVGMVS